MTDRTQQSQRSDQDDLAKAGADRTDADAAETSENRQFVSFTVGSEEYAIDIMAVREIKGWTGVTTLPNQPKAMRGVLNLRGAIIPIFDLRCRFYGELTVAKPTHVVIIASVGDRFAGILVDAVSDILNVESSEIRAAPTIEGHEDGGILAGLVTVNDRMVSLLDHKNLLSGAVMEHASLHASQVSAAVQAE